MHGRSDPSASVGEVPWSAPALVAGRYHVLRRLGVGGRAAVYLARDLATDEWRAVKIADPSLHDPDPHEWRRHFLGEARVAARLSHPSVIRVHEVLDDGAGPALVAEVAPGGSLEAWMAGNGPLPAERVAEVGLQCASALAHAHARGVLHGDVKPSNVLLRADGTVGLCDFGVAWRDAEVPPDARVLPFLAPELRAGGSPPSAGADVYGLGATLLALCTGRREPELFRCGQHPALLDGVPQALASVIAGCCQSDPAERPELDAVARGLASARDACVRSAVDLTDGAAPFPGSPTPEELDAIEALRVRLAAAAGDGLEEDPTEMYADLDAAPDEVVEADVSEPAEVALPAVAPETAEVWAAVGPAWPGPPRQRPPPIYPGILSALIFAVRGAVGLAGGARIGDRGPPPDRPHRPT